MCGCQIILCTYAAAKDRIDIVGIDKMIDEDSWKTKGGR